MSSPAPAHKMPYARLGNTGLLVSRLSFGSWVTFSNQIDTTSAYDLMKAAFAAGINFFDNAEVYAAGKSETIMGEAVARGVAEGVWAREDLVITTKLFFGTRPGVNNKGLSRKHIVEGTVQSLQRLQMSYVDVIYAHRPDPVTPIEEIVRAFNHIIDTGRAFYWGTSEWSCAQITEAVGVAARLGLVGPVVEQPEYNIFKRQRLEVEYAPLWAHGLGTTTWSPLCSGVLTGKYSGRVVPEGSRLAVGNYKFIHDNKMSGDESWQIDAADELKPIATDVGCSLAQLSIAWVLKNAHVSTCILGATSLAQLHENLGALAFVERLTPDVMARIDAVAGPARAALDKVQTQVRGVRDTANIANFTATS